VQPLLRPLEKFWAEFSGTERPPAMQKQSGAAGSHTDARQEEKQRAFSLNFRPLPAKAKPESTAPKAEPLQTSGGAREEPHAAPRGISEIKRARTQRAARDGDVPCWEGRPQPAGSERSRARTERPRRRFCFPRP